MAAFGISEREVDGVEAAMEREIREAEAREDARQFVQRRTALRDNGVLIGVTN